MKAGTAKPGWVLLFHWKWFCNTWTVCVTAVELILEKCLLDRNINCLDVWTVSDMSKKKIICRFNRNKIWQKMKLNLALIWIFFFQRFEVKKNYKRNGLVFPNSSPGEVIPNSMQVGFFLSRTRNYKIIKSLLWYSNGINVFYRYTKRRKMTLIVSLNSSDRTP